MRNWFRELVDSPCISAIIVGIFRQPVHAYISWSVKSFKHRLWKSLMHQLHLMKINLPSQRLPCKQSGVQQISASDASLDEVSVLCSEWESVSEAVIDCMSGRYFSRQVMHNALSPWDWFTVSLRSAQSSRSSWHLLILAFGAQDIMS